MEKLFNQAQGLLTDSEKDKLSKFNKDTELFGAVKKVLLMEIFANGTLDDKAIENPLRNFALTLAISTNGLPDEQVGKMLRAKWEGANMLETGFELLERFKEKAVISPIQDVEPKSV